MLRNSGHYGFFPQCICWCMHPGSVAYCYTTFNLADALDDGLSVFASLQLYLADTFGDILGVIQGALISVVRQRHEALPRLYKALFVQGDVRQRHVTEVGGILADSIINGVDV